MAAASRKAAQGGGAAAGGKTESTGGNATAASARPRIEPLGEDIAARIRAFRPPSMQPEDIINAEAATNTPVVLVQDAPKPRPMLKNRVIKKKPHLNLFS